MSRLRPLICLGLGLLGGCSRKTDTAAADPFTGGTGTSEPGLVVLPPDSPKLNQLRIEPVRTAEVPSDEVVAPGKIEVNPNRVSRVLLPLPGRVAAVTAQLGDQVKAGQPVVTMESAEADAAISSYRQAQASVGQAKAALVKAQADLDRVRDLYEHDAVARKEVLNAENALAQAKGNLEQAEASHQQVLGRLEILGLNPTEFHQKVVVRAPISGKVLEINVAPGEYRTDTNAPLMTIADLAVVWVTSDVPETAIRFIRPGERVEIELSAYPGETFYGGVARIADTVDPQTRTIKVRLEMDNPRGRFRPEMSGRIRHAGAKRLLPVVPAGAVIQGDGQNAVFVEQRRGVFRQTRVTVGSPVGDQMPILSGVKAGDRVVVDGAMLLRTTEETTR